MTIDDAKKIRDKYIKIIGMTGVTDAKIIDVIIEPLDVGIYSKFNALYVSLIRSGNNVDNDKMLQNFKSESYRVTVVLDYDGSRTQLMFDDIEAYKSLI